MASPPVVPGQGLYIPVDSHTSMSIRMEQSGLSGLFSFLERTQSCEDVWRGVKEGEEEEKEREEEEKEREEEENLPFWRWSW